MTIGLVLGAGGVVGQAYQAGVLAALERESGWDAAAGPRHRRHLGRLGHGCRAPGRCPGDGPRGIGLRRAHVPARRRHPPADPARRRRAAAGSERPRRVPALEPAVTGADRPRGATSPGLPSRSGRGDPGAPRPDRHLRPGRRARRAHRQPLARGSAHLRGPPERRRAGRVRPSRIAGIEAGSRGPGVVRHPGLLPPGHDRRHRVHRRGRALRDECGRPPVRGARPGGDRLVDVGRTRACARRGRPAPAERPSPHRTGGGEARAGRHRGDPPGARRRSAAGSWGSGRWPRTAGRGWSRPPTRRRAGGSSRRPSWPRSARRTPTRVAR